MISNQVKTQLEQVRQVAQKPTDPLSPATYNKAKDIVNESLNKLSIPNPNYYSNRPSGNYSLDFKPYEKLSNSDKEDMERLESIYIYKSDISLEEQFRRGFLGNPSLDENTSGLFKNTTKFFNYIRGLFQKNPSFKQANTASPSALNKFPYNDWLLVKHNGRVIAYMEAHRFSNLSPESYRNLFSQALVHRPMSKTCFLIGAVAVDPEFKRKNIFRLMLEALGSSYEAGFMISSVYPENLPSIEAHHAIGAEDVGSEKDGQRLFVLDFNKYIKHGEQKPIQILYPFVDAKNAYSNISNPISHSEILGTQYAVDFPLPLNTDIRAVADGIVRNVLDDNPDHNPGEASFDMDPKKCNFLHIEDEKGRIQEYVHIACKSSRVKVGDTVRAGDVICKSGHNGPSTAPHLHFNFLKKDTSNPNGYVSMPVRFVNGAALTVSTKPR